MAPQLALAAPFDLTGEWHGSEICDEVDAGKRNVFVETSPIFIRQEANGRFRMLFRLENGRADVIYGGLSQPADRPTAAGARGSRSPAAGRSRARR